MFTARCGAPAAPRPQTGDQLDDFLEQRAAKVETGGGIDSTTVSWSCLKEDFDDVFRVFEDLLRNPEFRAEKIEIAQKGMYDAISRRNDDPAADCGTGSGETGVWRKQSVRANPGVCNGGGDHTPGSGRVARQVRSSE